ncbi:unnamed protein product, partial [Medioppia subpectinata]
MNPWLPLHRSSRKSVLGVAVGGVKLDNGAYTADLASMPSFTIDSLDEIVNADRELTVLMEPTNYVYNYYLKIKYPDLNYELFRTTEMNDMSFLDPIIAGDHVLIHDEAVIDEIIGLSPWLPLHIADQKTMLGVSGVVVRKGWQPDIKQKFKTMLTMIHESGALLWRTRVNKIIERDIYPDDANYKPRDDANTFNKLTITDIKLFIQLCQPVMAITSTPETAAVGTNSTATAAAAAKTTATNTTAATNGTAGSVDRPVAAAGNGLPLGAMYVVKRDGRHESIMFDKITSRIVKLSYELDMRFVDPTAITLKVIAGLYSGVTTVQLDELAAEIAATMTTKHADYAKLAARIAVSNLHKETTKNFSDVIR